ncbi:MAG: hypothetical protein HUU50_03140 [Candidatus Brocadiae bacterium]|nr:hypothetical protein [Candidatus Brocadiia bacterium]
MNGPVEFYHLFIQKALEYSKSNQSSNKDDWENFKAKFLLIEQIFINPLGTITDYWDKLSNYFYRVPLSTKDTLLDWDLFYFNTRKMWRGRIVSYYHRYYEYMEKLLWEEAIRNLSPHFLILDTTFPKAPNQIAFVRALLRLIKSRNNEEIELQNDLKWILFILMPDSILDIFKETLISLSNGERASINDLDLEKTDITKQYDLILAQIESLKEEIDSLQKYIENKSQIQEHALNEVYRQWNIPSKGLPLKFLGNALLEINQNKNQRIEPFEKFQILSYWIQKLQEVFQGKLSLQINAENFGTVFYVDYYESFRFRYQGTAFKDVKEKKKVRIISYGWEICRKGLEKIIVIPPEIKEEEGS